MNIFENIREIIIEVAISIGVADKNILNKITAEPPKDELHGDIATNIALLSSKILLRNITLMYFLPILHCMVIYPKG